MHALEKVFGSMQLIFCILLPKSLCWLWTVCPSLGEQCAVWSAQWHCSVHCAVQCAQCTVHGALCCVHLEQDTFCKSVIWESLTPVYIPTQLAPANQFWWTLNTMESELRSTHNIDCISSRVWTPLNWREKKIVTLDKEEVIGIDLFNIIIIIGIFMILMIYCYLIWGGTYEQRIRQIHSLICSPSLNSPEGFCHHDHCHHYHDHYQWSRQNW